MSNSSFEAPSPEHLAELLPQYDIQAFIAQGGMGAVYRGRQSSLDRDVAVKVLPKELGADPEFRESFRTEAKAMARLNHPNLIGVYDFGDAEGMPYIVMEYVEGCSLHESAWNQVVDPAQAVSIVKAICDGLAHAHEHGIIHRDIKPANILLNLKAQPKIGDFGLANPTDSEELGLVMGTPGYTAPEVFQDAAQAGPLADLYSVGVIFHQLLTGIDPAGSEGPPTQATGNLRLDAIWRKATHVNPAQRYASVAAMAEELEKWSTSKPGTPVAGGAMPSSLAPARPTPQLVSQSSGGGGGMFVKVAIIAILGVVVVFTYQLLQEYKGDIKEKIADSQGHDLTEEPEAPEVVRLPETKPDPVVKPVEEPVEEPEPVEIAMTEEPEPVEEPEPEPAPEPEPVVAQLPPGDPELLEKAIGLIDGARKGRAKLLGDNARAVLFKLRVRAREVEQNEVDLIEALENDVKGDRLPIVADVRNMPAELEAIFKEGHLKEEEIESKYLTDLERIRSAYISRLQEAATTTEDEELKPKLLAQAGKADDLDAWIEALSPEPEVERKRSAGSLAGAGGFEGKWVIHTDNVTQWIADSKGVVTINDGKWAGKTAEWKILDNGTLEVHWADKPRPYVFEKDGAGWSGKTSFGKVARLEPGDW